MKKDYSHVWFWTAAAVLFASFEIGLILFIDRPLSEYLRALDAQHPAIINVFRNFTDLGKSKWYQWPSGIAALLFLAFSTWRQIPRKKRDLLRREGRMTGFFFICITIAGLVTDALKPIIGRARPVILDRHGFYGFDFLSFRRAHDAYNSFPSGHAATAFALAFALIALWPRGRPLLIAFAVSLALSRVMVNAHYLSDVFAGAAVGAFTSILIQKLFINLGWLAQTTTRKR